MAGAYLHGTGLCWLLLPQLLFYLVSTTGSTRAVWLLAAAVMLPYNALNSEGVSFGRLHGGWDWLVGRCLSVLVLMLAAQDRLEGAVRWHTVLNICSLRMISFCVDRIDATKQPANQPAAEKVEKVEQEAAVTQKAAAERTERGRKVRSETSRPLQEYTVLHYIAYVGYWPLYLAGPIMTFNDFARCLVPSISCVRP